MSFLCSFNLRPFADRYHLLPFLRWSDANGSLLFHFLQSPVELRRPRDIQTQQKSLSLLSYQQLMLLKTYQSQSSQDVWESLALGDRPRSNNEKVSKKSLKKVETGKTLKYLED